MLDRERIEEAFRTALQELRNQSSQFKPSFTQIADHARQVYCRDLMEGEKTPSLWTFRSCLLGKRANPRIVELVSGTSIHKMSRLDQGRLITCFREALETGKKDHGARLRPRTVAVIAHRLYGEKMRPGEMRPALISFLRRVSRKTADPVVMELLGNAGILSSRRAKLDRERLKGAFVECIKKFENRILRGIAKPVHVADSAHKIYVEGMDSDELKPSRMTFRRMIYGHDADPELASLLETHFPAKK